MRKKEQNISEASSKIKKYCKGKCLHQGRETTAGGIDAENGSNVSKNKVRSAIIMDVIRQQIEVAGNYKAAITKLKKPISTQCRLLTFSALHMDEIYRRYWGEGTSFLPARILAKQADDARIITNPSLIPPRCYFEIINTPQVYNEIRNHQEQRTLKKVLIKANLYNHWKTHYSKLGFNSTEDFNKVANLPMLMLASQVCHVQDVHFFIEQETGLLNTGAEFGFEKIRNGNLAEFVPTTLLSIPCINFSYGEASVTARNMLQNHHGMVEIRRLLYGIWQNAFEATIAKGCTSMSIAAIGLGEFIKGLPSYKRNKIAELYFATFFKVLNSNSRYKHKIKHIFYNTGPYSGFFIKELSKYSIDNDPNACYVENFKGDSKLLAVELGKAGEKCAFINPSDADVIWAKNDIGEYYKHNPWALEESIAVTSTAFAGSCCISDVYQNREKIMAYQNLASNLNGADSNAMDSDHDDQKHPEVSPSHPHSDPHYSQQPEWLPRTVHLDGGVMDESADDQKHPDVMDLSEAKNQYIRDPANGIENPSQQSESATWYTTTNLISQSCFRLQTKVQGVENLNRAKDFYIIICSELIDPRVDSGHQFYIGEIMKVLSYMLDPHKSYMKNHDGKIYYKSGGGLNNYMVSLQSELDKARCQLLRDAPDWIFSIDDSGNEIPAHEAIDKLQNLIFSDPVEMSNAGELLAEQKEITRNIENDIIVYRAKNDELCVKFTSRAKRDAALATYFTSTASIPEQFRIGPQFEHNPEGLTPCCYPGQDTCLFFPSYKSADGEFAVNLVTETNRNKFIYMLGVTPDENGEIVGRIAIKRCSWNSAVETWWDKPNTPGQCTTKTALYFTELSKTFSNKSGNIGKGFHMRGECAQVLEGGACLRNFTESQAHILRAGQEPEQAQGERRNRLTISRLAW